MMDKETVQDKSLTGHHASNVGRTGLCLSKGRTNKMNVCANVSEILTQIKQNSRVAVVGSRSYSDLQSVRDFVGYLPQKCTLVSGGAWGVDKAGECGAKLRNMKTDIYLPDWDKYGKTAGVLRNRKIVENSDFVVAFWKTGSKGTESTIQIAKELGKPLCIIGGYKEEVVQDTLGVDDAGQWAKLEKETVLRSRFEAVHRKDLARQFHERNGYWPRSASEVDDLNMLASSWGEEAPISVVIRRMNNHDKWLLSQEPMTTRLEDSDTTNQVIATRYPSEDLALSYGGEEYSTDIVDKKLVSEETDWEAEREASLERKRQATIRMDNAVAKGKAEYESYLLQNELLEEADMPLSSFA